MSAEVEIVLKEYVFLVRRNWEKLAIATHFEYLLAEGFDFVRSMIRGARRDAGLSVDIEFGFA